MWKEFCRSAFFVILLIVISCQSSLAQGPWFLTCKDLCLEQFPGEQGFCSRLCDAIESQQFSASSPFPKCKKICKEQCNNSGHSHCEERCEMFCRKLNGELAFATSSNPTQLEVIVYYIPNEAYLVATPLSSNSCQARCQTIVCPVQTRPCCVRRRILCRN